MNPVYEKLCACFESIRERIPFTPEVALVLGSGLGNYASQMKRYGNNSIWRDRWVSSIDSTRACRAVCLWLCRRYTSGSYAGACALL